MKKIETVYCNLFQFYYLRPRINFMIGFIRRFNSYFLTFLGKLVVPISHELYQKKFIITWIAIEVKLGLQINDLHSTLLIIRHQLWRGYNICQSRIDFSLRFLSYLSSFSFSPIPFSYFKLHSYRVFLSSMALNFVKIYLYI